VSCHQLAVSLQPYEGRRAGMVRGEPWLTVLGPPCLPHPSAGGLGQVAGGRAGPAQWEGTSYH
jgi:hypothetical protein